MAHADLAPRDWTRQESRQLQEFWQDRYADPRASLRAVGWGREHEAERFSSAGGEKLFVPRLHADLDRDGMRAAFEAHEKARWQEHDNAHREDKFRLRIVMGVESHLYDAWNARQMGQENPDRKMQCEQLARKEERRAAQSLGRLLDYDHTHGHPVANADRSLADHPPTLVEKEQWLSRGDRRMTQIDRETLHENGLVHEKSLPALRAMGASQLRGKRGEEPEGPPPMRPSDSTWWVDRETARVVSARGEEDRIARLEIEIDEKRKQSGLIVPGLEGPSWVEDKTVRVDGRLPIEEQRRLAAQQQLEHIREPMVERWKSAQDVSRDAVARAGRIDPEWNRELHHRHERGEAREFVADELKQANRRLEQVERKLTEGKPLLPLRGTDVALLRGQSQVKDLGRDRPGDAFDQAGQAAVEAQQAAFNEHVLSMRDRLLARRERTQSPTPEAPARSVQDTAPARPSGLPEAARGATATDGPSPSRPAGLPAVPGRAARGEDAPVSLRRPEGLPQVARPHSDDATTAPVRPMGLPDIGRAPKTPTPDRGRAVGLDR